ncbi:MAG TPA: photosynthetic reaction center cytochrome c subunit family protein [Terriglobia bacterium]|nr:photosynthetic reaction center cytochrome c subunit family protein [Terriglobia bacterium]
MKLRSTRMVLGVIGVLVLGLMGVVLARGQAAQAQRPQMAEEVFKNVQVLKGIPVDEFMDTMGMFAASLSLNCIDCHVAESVDKWDRFADETPLKRTARTMLLMVTAINKENFKGVRSVSCYTCHRGDLRPKVVPSLIVQYSAPVEDPNEVEIPPNAKGPSPDEVFSKYIQALGGAQRLASLTSFTASGTFIGFETEQTKVPVDIFVKAPAQRTTVVHTRLGDSVRVYDGRAAWIAAPDRPLPLMTLTGGNLEGARIDGILSFPTQLRQAFTQWRVGATAIDDKDVVVLQGTSPRQPPVNLYFDNSGLLVRVVRLVDTAVGRVPTQIDYSDYREVAGVKMPFHWTVTWTDGQATTELSEVRPNVAIDAARFARPAPAPQPK